MNYSNQTKLYDKGKSESNHMPRFLTSTGRLVGNYGFLDGQEKCYQSRLGSVVFIWLDGVDRQNIKMFDISLALPNSVSRPWPHPPGNSPLVCLCGLLNILPVLSYTITVLSGSTCQLVIVL